MPVAMAAAALLAGVVGLAAVLVVQARANIALGAANDELRRSKAAVQERYDLATSAIKTFHTGVTEDFLLKQDQFKELRDRLLTSASEFYGKLGGLLGTETDPASRQALLKANFELSELTAKVGRAEDALAAHRKVLAARESLAAETGAGDGVRADVGRSLIAIALLLESTGQTEEALALYRDAERRLDQGTLAAAAASKTALVDCRSHMGWLLRTMGRADLALSVLRMARADIQSLPRAAGSAARSMNDEAMTTNRLGLVLSETGRMPEAEAEYRAAQSIWRTLTEQYPTDVDFRRYLAHAHNNLGNLLSDTGRPRQAEAECRSSLAIRQALATQHPAVTGLADDVATSHYNLAILLLSTGQMSGAEAESRTAVSIWTKLSLEHQDVTRFHDLVARCHPTLAYLLSAADRPAEAQSEFRAALALELALIAHEPDVPEFRVNQAICHNGLGELLSWSGRPYEAEAEHRLGLAIFKKLVDENPRVSVN
jgi:tetratricopeptide (TPR) repeat protein